MYKDDPESFSTAIKGTPYFCIYSTKMSAFNLGESISSIHENEYRI